MLCYMYLQIRVIQGHEPAAFLNLFSGKMVVHSGKKSEKQSEKRWRLYICRGTLESEIFLIEIPCSTRQLRSRCSFVLLDTKNAKVYVWHGNNSLPHIRKVYFLIILICVYMPNEFDNAIFINNYFFSYFRLLIFIFFFLIYFLFFIEFYLYIVCIILIFLNPQKFKFQFLMILYCVGHALSMK